MGKIKAGETVTINFEVHSDTTVESVIQHATEQIREMFAESEDEQVIRIIKKRMCYDPVPISDEDRRIVENWLEKHKEPIPIPDKFSGLKSLLLQYLQSAANRTDDTEIESDTDLFGRKILDYVWKYSEKQKVQKESTNSGKPKEWSEEDEKRRNNILRLITEANDRYIREQGRSPFSSDILWLKDLTERFNLQLKQEWSDEDVLNRVYEEGFNDGIKYRKPVNRSDEDRKMAHWLIGLVNANTELSFSNKTNLTRWLEHLTIEKELSKNDKRIIDAIMIGYQDKDFRSSQIPTPIGVSKDEVINWLKSLRPSWKPSKEQMGALNYAYCELFKREDVGHNILGPLQNLIDILSKL